MDRKTVRNVLDWYKQTHIKGVPAGVVEVVRCRECKHRKYGNYSKEYYCEYDAIVPYERKRNANDREWFCADGEKE